MDSMSYIGRKPCGCVVAAVVDQSDNRKGTADWVHRMIMDGLTVERVPHEYVREHLKWDCPHEPKQLELFDK